MVSEVEIKIVFCGSDTTFVHTIELSVVDAGSTTTLVVLGRVNDVKYDVPPTNAVVLLVSGDELVVVEFSERRFKLVTSKLSDNEVL